MLKRIRRLISTVALVSVCALLDAAHAFAQDTSLTDINYRLGNGFQIPNTGWTLGGYATGSYDHLSNETSRLNLDNLSLFLWWEGDGRWKFFSEIEFENFAKSRRETGGKDGYLSLERLYVDYALTDTATVRAGKFLTPIGHWNLVHATPLVWTTSRPLATTLAFPTNMTGIEVTGTLPSIAGGLEYSVYGSGTNDLRTNPDQDPFAAAVGGHITLPISQESQLGFSFSNFEQARTKFERKQLYGLDYLWTHNRFELSVEGIYRFSDDGGWDERGGFVQLAAPLSEKLFVVGRAEVFRSAGRPNATALGVAGLNYRLMPALILKAEWISSRHNTIHAPEGFLSSISVLF